MCGVLLWIGCDNEQEDAVFVELMLQHLPAPVLSVAWEVQTAARRMELIQKHGDGDSIAAAKSILFGVFLFMLVRRRKCFCGDF